MTTYSYETFPDQTYVRTTPDGYSPSELIDELHQNGCGIVVIDNERADGFCRAMEGLPAADIEAVQFSDHGCGRKSVLFVGANGKVLRDYNL
jgi:hypothetical protein